MSAFLPLGSLLASLLAVAVLAPLTVPAVTSLRILLVLTAHMLLGRLTVPSLLALAVIPLGLSTPLPEVVLVTASLSKLERAADAPLLLLGEELFWVNPSGGSSLLDRDLI